jgi:hypothetical protein
MTEDDDRNLTAADVSAIVTELKTQLVKDFRLEVGRGVLDLVKKALLVLLLFLALQGMAGDKSFINQITAQPPK